MRIWRLRKRQETIDASVGRNDKGRVVLEFTMNGRRLTARTYTTRRQAIAAATEKRRELERAGWTTHW